MSFEGYGPGGVAVMLELLTDNRNRTTPEIRHLFSRFGGNLGENGCVAWLFTRTGLILVPRSADIDEDTVMELALEAGAQDLDTDDADYFRDLHRAPKSCTRSRTASRPEGSWSRPRSSRWSLHRRPVSKANRRTR